MEKSKHPLKAYRERCKPPMTQDELAQALGVTKAAVSRWETGERFPERQFWQRIHEVTGISLKQLSEAARSEAA